QARGEGSIPFARSNRPAPPEVTKVNEREVRELFFERLQHLSAEAEYELRHPDYVMEMPQSGERIRGRDRMQAFQEAYPNPPTIQPRRVVGSGDVWVVEARSDYGDGQIFNVAMIVEFRDGKIWRDTRYYAQPFEAPAWRAQWVEPMEE
ncbi:MAG TPA: nuclear transport factor 2 family protein, partial [Actinomycetota bacterium]|nr:nuclear transport factor 2 family protein [Actinomycetota bacterium]